MRVPLKITVADDDEGYALLLKEAAAEEQLNLDFYFAENGLELLRILQAKPAQSLPDLVLLDLNMPGKEGRECLKEIKQDSLLKKIPVLIFSTSEAEEMVEECYALGASSYIVKPFDFEGIMATLREIYTYWGKTCRLHSSNNTG